MLPGLCLADSGKKDNGEAPMLPEVVVTAARSEQRIERAPAHVTVITREDIENSNAATIPDLLRYEAGITVRDPLSNGKTAQVDLRGFGETGPYNTLVLIDGRRVNGIDLSGVDWTQIPVDQIEKIEIVRGTGSVLYGDNAVGGVINIITKIPSERLQTRAELSIGSYNFRGGTASVGGGSKDVTGLLSVSFQNTDGYRQNNEFNAIDFGGKIAYDLSDSFNLNFSGSFHADKYGLPGPLTAAELAADRRQSRDPLDHGKDRDAYLKAGLDWEIGGAGNLVSDFSYRSRSSDAFFPDPTGVFPQATSYYTVSWGITPRYVWSADLFERRNTLIAGVDLYWSDQDIDTYGGFFIPETTPTGRSDVSRNTAGVYFNNELSVKDNIILSLGARYETARYELNQSDLTGVLAPLNEETTKNEPAYNVGLTFLYNEKSSVFVRANRSFRFPLTDEVAYVDWSTFTIRANLELQPQTGYHYETGIKHYFTKEIMGNLTLFRAEIENELFYNPSPVFRNENHPETLHQGLEIGCRANLLKNLVVYGNYTYENATFEKEPYKGNDIPAVPNHKANLGFSIRDFTTSGMTLIADYNYVGSSHAISDQANNFDKLKAYHTIDAKLSYQWKTLKAFIGVNNITDQRYAGYAVMDTFLTEPNYFPAPERNWVAGVQYIY